MRDELDRLSWCGSAAPSPTVMLAAPIQLSSEDSAQNGELLSRRAWLSSALQLSWGRG